MLLRYSSNLLRGTSRELGSYYRNIHLCSTAFVKKSGWTEDGDYVEVKPPARENPIKRTARILKHDLKSLWVKDQPKLLEFSSHCDVLIIGGGIIGSSIAYWLKQRIPRKALRVVVVEKDPTYTRSATGLSAGGLRQQFSSKENIEMALFAAEFFRKVGQHLEVEGMPPPDIQYHPYGFLQLANEETADQLEENWLLQKELGAKVELLTKKRINEQFPWINTEDIELGCYGIENEGWFDPWSYLYGLQRKAIYHEVEFVTAEVIGFDFNEDSYTRVSGLDDDEKHSQIDKVIVRNPSGEVKTINFAICVVAAGHESVKIAEMARIGRGKSTLSVPLPIEPRKRYVYCFHAPGGPTLDCPLVVDPSGAYFRREGYAGHYVAGQAPPITDEPNVEHLDVDYSYFDNTVFPNISHRVPSIRNPKMTSAWAGYYDYNYFDQSGILGCHPYHVNMMFACGFSGYGIQQSPAIGRAMMELLLDGQFRTIDLSKLDFDRLMVGRESKETNVS